MPDSGLAELLHVQEPTSDSRRANPFVAALKCSLLVRRRGSDGVIFPEFADFVSSIFCIDPFGEETMLVDAERPNTVCWNNASREFLAVIKKMVLEHPRIRMVRTTAQRYYDFGAPLKIFHDSHDDDYVLMPLVEGEIAEGGYMTPHWVPTMFVWNGE